MGDQQVYRLGEHVAIEPLVSRWPAWWCTVAPVAASFHAARYQLTLLRSYVSDPATHLKAARDPNLVGGPFVNVPEKDVDLVRELLTCMTSDFTDAVAFADAWWMFSEKLSVEALGQSLEPYYQELPASLRGLVELVYDYWNRPTIRADEGLAYLSSLYKPDLQALRLFALDRDGDRPFFMSTPIVGNTSDEALLRLPFADPRVRKLFSLDLEPQPREAIGAVLGQDLGRSHAQLFEVGPPRVTPAYEGPGVRLRYFGHATVLVESAESSILLDPFLEVHPRNADSPRFSWSELPAHIDFALITHAHPDHFAPETLLRLLPRVGTLVVPRNHGLATGDVSLRRVAQHLGYTDVRELDTLDSIRLTDGRLVALPFYGEHGDVAHGNKATYLVRLGTRTLLFAADSMCLDPETYGRICRSEGPIETVFLNTETEGAPVSWSFEALFPKRGRDRKREASRRCRGSNAAEGLRLLEVVGAKRMYNYAMGLEPWMQRIIGPAPAKDAQRIRESDDLIARAKERGLEAARLDGSSVVVLDS